MRRRSTWLPVAAFVLLPWSAPAVGADGVPGPQAAADVGAEVVVPTAPVILDGVTLLRVRGISSMPAADRAAAIASHIGEVAADAALRPEDVVVVSVEGRLQIVAGRRPVMTVRDSDAQLEGVATAVLANGHLLRIRHAIVRYRAERSREYLVRSAALSAAVVVGALVLMWVVVRLLRKLAKVMDERYRARVRSLGVKSFEIVRAERIWAAINAGRRVVRTLFVLGIAVVALDVVLRLFPWTRPASDRLTGYVTQPLGTMLGALVATLPDLVFLAILFLVVRYLLGLVRLFFEAVEKKSLSLEGFEPEWAIPTYKIVRIGVVAFALVVAYPYVPGSSSAAFKGVSLFLGLVLSLGSSSFVNNTIAGYSLTYRRAFRLGDVVKIGDVVGTVTEIRIQVTHLRTRKNEEVVIPNSAILSSSVVNYSRLAATEGLILHTTVGIGYETPWRQVEAMLLMAADRAAGILKEPRPFVFQTLLGDFCVTYELNAYCDTPERMWAFYAELHRHVLDVFNEYGIQIMTPAYERDPETPKVVPREQWHAAPAAPRLEGPVGSGG